MDKDAYMVHYLISKRKTKLQLQLYHIQNVEITRHNARTKLHFPLLKKKKKKVTFSFVFSTTKHVMVFIIHYNG